MLRAAGIPEVIRSHQKDDSFINYCRSLVVDLSQTILGPRIWLQWRKQLDLAADVTYFLLTTFSDLQTVGEEYVNIIQTDQTLRALPSRWRRALMVLLQVVAPHLLKASIEKFQHQLQHSTSLQILPATRERILKILPLISKVVSLSHRLHLATFYINGIFYHLAKRVSGVRYVQIMPRGQGLSPSRPFAILGYLSLLQLSLSFLISSLAVISAFKNSHLSNERLNEFDEYGPDYSAVLPNEKCPLCLGRRRRTTLTPCGHLYCWHCILEWCQSKQECPLCRENFPAHRLIVLQNYDDS